MGNFPSFPGLPGGTTSSVASFVTTAPSGCPTITLTTQTEYFEVTASNRVTRTLFQTATAYIYPSTVTVTPTSTITLNSYQSTVTTTQTTSTVVVFSLVSPTETIRQPTPANFTPLRCDKAYFNPTTTITNTYSGEHQITPTVTSRALTPATMYAVPIYTFLTVPQLGASVVTYWPTVTTTSVRNERTTTLYAACATNNVVAQAPPYKNETGYLSYLYQKAGWIAAAYPGVDAIDCCGRCQARENCTGSVWYTFRPQQCVHILKPASEDQTCNARTVGGQLQGLEPRDYLYASNGRCGQWTFGNL